MALTLQWNDIALRLVLTIIAGTLVGIDRSERGQPAGLRTTILVCLAAAVAMIQTNLLLPMGGRAPDSFATLDLMRLPLGILTGMGFIGGGAILRRGNMVQGVTTAATLWLVTVIGLCLGGGQLALGMTTLAVALLVLWAMKRLESVIRLERHATLRVSVNAEGPTDDDIPAMLSRAGFKIRSWDVISRRGDAAAPLRKLRCDVSWHGRRDDILSPPIVEQIAQLPGVTRLRWKA
jgi:putative Mg2+ transporter-C (MgtC) family protein